MSPRIWLITGTSSGFGLELTKIALNRGDTVIATARRPETLSHLTSSYSSDRLLALKLDVTQLSDILSVFATIKEKFGRLDVVVNNAGYGDAGEVEAADDKAMRTMFEANFWGLAYITREAVKMMREVNPPGAGGRILEFTSTVGIEAVPAFSYYGASKAAVENFGEALAAELDPDWNIKVTIVCPGPFDTGSVAKIPFAPLLPAYDNPKLIGKVLRQGWSRAGDPRKAMELVYKVSQLEDPPVHFPLGPEAVQAFKDKGAALIREADRYAEWNSVLHKDA